MERRLATIAAVVVAAAAAVLITAPPISASATNLTILVPLKKGFNEFVRWSSPDSPITPNSTVVFSGFVIEVFRKCIKRLNDSINYTLVPFGDGIDDPSYGKIVEKLVSGEADGAAADLTITSERLQVVDFTQPYLQSSLQMVVPIKSKDNLGIGILSSPFSPDLWLAIGVTFVATIVSLAIVEPFDPPAEIERFHWRQRLVKSLWFTCMAIFFIHRRDVRSHLGRALALAWLLLVLTFTSSYTASLSSIIISRQRDIPTLTSFSDLVNSTKQHNRIGCQEGSFTIDYFKDVYKIPTDRLANLVTLENYATALVKNEPPNVAAIVDESPYVDVFLSNKSYCQGLKLVDSNIAYFGGLAFAFNKNYSSLADSMSFAILDLEQTGDLQRLKDKWLGSGQCPPLTDSGDALSLNSFHALFFYVMPGVYGFFILARLVRQLYVWIQRMRLQ